MTTRSKSAELIKKLEIMNLETTINNDNIATAILIRNGCMAITKVFNIKSKFLKIDQFKKVYDLFKKYFII
jgi:hypothetical protein